MSVRDRPAVPIYFLHIPKTAGSSVIHWLHRQVEEGAARPVRMWDQLVRIDSTRLENYALFTGHFGMDLEDYLKRQLLTVTLLRDPVLRTISHYHDVRRHPHHPWHRSVVNETFDEFVRNHHNWPMIENMQARYLVKSPISFKDFSFPLNPRAQAQYRLSVVAEDTRFLFDPIYVREKSLEALETSLSVVGVSHRIHDFLCCVANACCFSPPLQDDVPFENTSPVSAKDVQIASDTLDVVMELTAIDQELYDRCNRVGAGAEPIDAVKDMPTA
jgi:hypothetical protein